MRIERAVSREVIDRLQKRLLNDYPAPPQQNVLVNFEVGETATKIQQEFQGYKLTSSDGTAIVTIGPSIIASSRLAPYEGWEPFVSQARKNWDIWKRIVGHQKITRIGVRYINRIDIPNPEDKPVSISDYLCFFPVMPKFGQPPMETFAINCVTPLGKDDCKLILNASSAPSPLVKTISFILDLDISKDVNVPQSDEALWSFIDVVRDHKNLVFESCITDRSRQLFSS